MGWLVVRWGHTWTWAPVTHQVAARFSHTLSLSFFLRVVTNIYIRIVITENHKLGPLSFP